MYRACAIGRLSEVDVRKEHVEIASDDEQIDLVASGLFLELLADCENLLESSFGLLSSVEVTGSKSDDAVVLIL